MLCCSTGRVMYKTSVDLQESLFTCLRLLCRRTEVSEAVRLYFEHPVNHTEHPVNHAAVPHAARFSDISCSCAIPRAFVQHPIAQIRTTANRLLRTVICIIKTWQSREDNIRVLGFSLLRLLGWHLRTKPYILIRSCKFSGSEKYWGSKAVQLVSDFCRCCFQSSVFGCSHRFSRAVSRRLGASCHMFCLGWLRSVVLCWLVSRSLARQFLAKCHLWNRNTRPGIQLFKAIVQGNPVSGTLCVRISDGTILNKSSDCLHQRAIAEGDKPCSPTLHLPRLSHS